MNTESIGPSVPQNQSSTPSIGPLDQMAGLDGNPVLDDLVRQGMQAMEAQANAETWRHKQDLLAYCQKFMIDSISWRRTSFEPDWYLFRRNADSIYDPNILTRKESWQSRAFIPMTASHRENIHAALFKMLVGNRPCLEMRPRYDQLTEDDQSDNIRDIILREMEKTRFEKEFNMVLDDATTFGTGFMRIRYETKEEMRMVRSAIYDKLRVTDQLQLKQSFDGTRNPTQFKGEPKKIVTYRGIRCEWLSIWDIFPDPKAFGITGQSVAYRFFYTYGQIIDGIKNGFYFPECAHLLRNAPSREIEPVDRAIVMADRTISPSYPRRTDYARRIQCHELYMRLPKKWVFLRGEQVDDPETLVPARVLMAGEPEGPIQALLSIELNEDYQGEAPIYKMDFLPVADRFYGRGIAEMLKHIQEIVNETCNQRIDNIAISMNRMFAVIEKGMVDPGDLVSKPGAVFRLDGRYVQDVRQAFMPLEMPDITVSAYKDVQELERYAQERTSANRVTLGTNGLVNDANRTATGLEILRQSAGEKFAYIGMLMEYNALYDIFRAIWKNVYANIQPDDVIASLGPERAAKFKLMSPEEIEEQYLYEPQGIFTMENKALTQQRLQGIDQQFANMPWLNRMALFERECKANNIDPNSLLYSPQDMQMNMQAQAHMSGAIAPPGQAPGEAQAQQMQQKAQQGPQNAAGPQPTPPQEPVKSDEQQLDEMAARLAVKKGMISPKEARERLRIKYEGKNARS